MPETAQALATDLCGHFNAFYDDSGSIGKRYRRMDEAGTPFCITVDGETMETGTVTIRDRDSMIQKRIPKNNAADYLKDRMRTWSRSAE